MCCNGMATTTTATAATTTMIFVEPATFFLPTLNILTVSYGHFNVCYSSFYFLCSTIFIVAVLYLLTGLFVYYGISVLRMMGI